MIQYLKNCVASAMTGKYTPPPIGVCPRCGNAILEGKKSYYCTGYKHENRCSFSIFKSIAGANLSMEDIALLLSHKTTGVKICVSKSGKNFKAALYLDKDETIAFQFNNHGKGGNSALKQKKGAKHGNSTA
jgi:hypothetical protein